MPSITRFGLKLSFINSIELTNDEIPSKAKNSDWRGIIIEWDATNGNFIMPPTEVRERIDENCRKIGYDRGVIVSMSVFEAKIVADFDCRGADAT